MKNKQKKTTKEISETTEIGFTTVHPIMKSRKGCDLDSP